LLTGPAFAPWLLLSGAPHYRSHCPGKFVKNQ
jgi:hypothetical protein